MENDNIIHIALSPWDLTDEYNRHAGVTLLSILEHSNKQVIVHLLYDERLCVGKEKETEYNKMCYQKIADKYNCKIIYHNIIVPDFVINISNVKKWTPGALLRLHLAELLLDLKKIIYFDCDMVVNTYIDNLWKIELNDTFLGACTDYSIPNFSRKRKRKLMKLGISVDKYFCTGTLVLNLEKIRENPNSFTKTIYQFLSDNPNLPYPDQDMLNWYCQGNYTILPAKYNVYSSMVNSIKYANDAVIHYASLKKPWKMYSGEIDLYYWKYAKQTPWLENRDTLIHALLAAPDVEKSLSYVQKYFLISFFNGSNLEKVKKTLKFLGSIIPSFFRWLKKEMR